MKKNKALFAISSLGLGHATRTLVIVNYFLKKGYEIDIVSFGNAINFLKSELYNKKVNFIEFSDYPHLERGKGWKFYFYIIIDLIKTTFIIKKEFNFLRKVENKYDFIFSDGRYGFNSLKTPSFFLTHQLAFIMPKGSSLLSKFFEKFNYFSFKKFHHIFIPDYSYSSQSLAGDLSHPKWVNNLNHSYIGILSSFYDDIDIKKSNKIDYLFTISGYLIENKENFINSLLEQSRKLVGKKVFILGDTKKDYKKELENDITIYSFVGGENRKQLFIDADIIISRAGYTTIMDLVELGKKAILFPTPNQTEQEYLSKFLKQNNSFVFGEKNSNLAELIKDLENTRLFETDIKTKYALEEIEKVIFKFI